jgi:pilus assembly protein Flp/PilA
MRRLPGETIHSYGGKVYRGGAIYPYLHVVVISAIIRGPIVPTFNKLRSQAGQGLAEYALILALIAIAAVLALLFLSGTIQSILSIIGKRL